MTKEKRADGSGKKTMFIAGESWQFCKCLTLLSHETKGQTRKIHQKKQKKMRKLIYGSLFLASVGIGLIGCKKNEKEQIEEIVDYPYELSSVGNLYFDEVNNLIYDSPESAGSNRNPLTEHNIELSIISKNYMPQFNSPEEIAEFVQYHLSDFDGKIIFKVDHQVMYRATIEKGEVVNEFFAPRAAAPGGNYPCSFDGLSHCTQDRIAAMNWFDTALCIYSGFACVMTNFVSCGVDNC